MTKKKSQKNLPKDSSVLIGTGIVLIVLSPIAWIILNAIYLAVRETSCDLTCVIAGAAGVYLGAAAVGIAGLIILISGIVKYAIESKKS